MLFSLGCGKKDDVARVAVPLGDSPQRGPANAWVTIVEFSDFQCPYCKQAESTLAQLQAQYPNDLRVVYMHFPLSFHQYALNAALASECARDQGKFWEMHDRLFEISPNLDDAALTGAAQGLGLDAAAFQACLQGATPKPRIDADVARGQSLGVKATPTFFVNGRSVEGALGFDEFKKLVDEELSRARDSGVSHDRYYDEVVLGH